MDNVMKQVRDNSDGGTIKKDDSNEDSKTLDEIIQARKLYENISEEDEKPAKPDDKNDEAKVGKKGESGYTKQELDKMNRLIEIMSK